MFVEKSNNKRVIVIIQWSFVDFEYVIILHKFLPEFQVSRHASRQQQSASSYALGDEVFTSSFKGNKT